MNKNKLLIIFLLIMLLLSSIPFQNTSVKAVWLNPGVFVACTMENYSVVAPMNFTSILIYTTNVSFNGIGFNLTAPSKVYVNFSTMTDHPKTTVAGDVVVTFFAYTTGAMTYNLTGLRSTHTYTLWNHTASETRSTDSYGRLQWTKPAPGGATTFTFSLTDGTTDVLKVTTNATTLITYSTATLNGFLDNDGGGANATVNFQYGTSTAYGNNTGTQVKSSGDTYSIGISSLWANTTYHYRAKAVNATLTVYGLDMTFVTSITTVNDPYRFRANWTTNNNLNISWTKGTSTTKTTIIRKLGSYPSSVIDGTVVYDNTGTYINMSVSPALQYFYRGFGWNASGYSTGVNITMIRTLNTTSYGASWLEFKAYLDTGHSVRENYRYATNPILTSTGVTNITRKQNFTGLPDWSNFVSSTYLAGQSFKTGTKGYYLHNITTLLRRIGNPPVLYLYLYIANTSGATYGLPTGPAKSNGTFDASLISTETNQWVNVSMSPAYLKSNTKYCLIAKSDGAYPANYLNMWERIDIHATYPDGCTVISTDGGATFHNDTVFSASDTLFEIWATETGTMGTYLTTSNTTITTTQYSNTTQTSLTPGQMYWYRGHANDSAGNLTLGNIRYSLTRPDFPLFLNIVPNFGAHTLNISWLNGTGSNRTVVVNSVTGYPDIPGDGTIVYNGTAKYVVLSGISFNTSYHFSLFGFTLWGSMSRFSSPTHVPWGGISFIVRNESRPWQIIRANITVTDSEGLHPTQFVNVYGWYSFNISSIPYGENTLFYVSNNSYHSRLYPIDILSSTFYNLTFYIPPKKMPLTGPTGSNITGSYMLQVINEEQLPVKGATVKFYKYFNTTANWTYIGGFVSDGNGQGSIDLFPYNLYMIKIHCTGYQNATEFWAPNVVEQSLIKVYKLYIAGASAVNQHIYDDYVAFTGTLTNSTGLLNILYTDSLASTTDWTVLVYSMNPSGTQTLIRTYTGTNSSFILSTIVSNTLDYHIIINLNHTVFGAISDDFFITGYHLHMTGKGAKFNSLMNLNFGYNPFGWSNTVVLIMCLGIFFSFGRRETYMSVMFLGGILLFLDIYIGFPSFVNLLFGGFFPVLLIFIGILMMVRDRGMFGAS